jgi:hypothetical protein
MSHEIFTHRSNQWWRRLWPQSDLSVAFSLGLGLWLFPGVTHIGHGAQSSGRPSVAAGDVTLHPSGESPNRPFEVVGFLRDTKSSGSYSLCEKLVVLRLTKRAQAYAGVGGKASVEIVGQLIARTNNAILWAHTNKLNRVGLGPLGGLNVASTAFMGQAAAATLRTMPKNK